MKKFALLILLGCLSLAMTSTIAGAHKVNVFAYNEGGKLLGESYFPGGKKVRGARVELLDQNGNLLAHTLTGPKGKFTLPLPSGTNQLKVVVLAGQGHRGVFSLEPISKEPASNQDSTRSVSTQGPSDTEVISGLDKKEIEAAISKTLDRKLAPLHARLDQLTKQAQAVSVEKVVGGLGWIMGLIGIAAYFLSRKRAG